MRHNKSGRKFGRPHNQRKSLLKGLLNSFFEHEAINTTEQKAKSLRPLAERLITLARADTMANRRLAFSRLGQKRTVKRLFDEIAPRYTERPGGYTRILKLGERRGDAAKMAQIRLV